MKLNAFVNVSVFKILFYLLRVLFSSNESTVYLLFD